MAASKRGLSPPLERQGMAGFKGQGNPLRAASLHRVEDGSMSPRDADLPHKRPSTAKPSREEAEAAVRTLLRWAGDDPQREGLLDTPSRVVRAYEEWFSGYDADPEEI